MLYLHHILDELGYPRITILGLLSALELHSHPDSVALRIRGTRITRSATSPISDYPYWFFAVPVDWFL